jgi:TolB-like protein
VRTLRIALAVLLIAPAALRAQAITVAIFPLSGFAMGEDGAALAATVRDMLVTELAKNTKLKAVDRGSIDELIRSQQLSLSGKLKDDDVMKVGALLGAQYALAGSISVVGKDAQLSLRIVDIETGENSHPFSDRVPKDQLLSLVDKAAATFGDLKLKARVADVVVPIPSVFAYSRGLDYEQRGEKSKAAAMYEAALKIFPENAAAKTALSRVK